MKCIEKPLHTLEKVTSRTEYCRRICQAIRDIMQLTYRKCFYCLTFVVLQKSVHSRGGSFALMRHGVGPTRITPVCLLCGTRVCRDIFSATTDLVPKLQMSGVTSSCEKIIFADHGLHFVAGSFDIRSLERSRKSV